MSFLPNLAGWALSGGAGSGGDDNNDNNNDEQGDGNDGPIQETEEEIRAKRLARLEARFGTKTKASDSETASNANAESDNTNISKNNANNQMDDAEGLKADLPTPMDIETSVKDVNSNADADVPMNDSAVGKTKSKSDEGPLAKKIKGKESETGTGNTQSPTKPDPMRKIQRKKEILLKKTLKIKVTGGLMNMNDSGSGYDLAEIDIGSPSITVESVSEILASRLAMSKNSLQNSPSASKGLFAYLGACHKRVSEELKNIPAPKGTGSGTGTGTGTGTDDTLNESLRDILGEMKRQVVSYAATSLMAPDLFESAKDGPFQLAACLTSATLDPASSITIGMAGKKTSFWTALCDELCEQDESVFESVIMEIVDILKKELAKSETILEESGSSGLVQVAALTALCSYKKAAIVLAETPQFLLPSAGSAAAKERKTAPVPPPPPGANAQELAIYRMMTAVTQGRGSYLKRSGPALEKETLLGLVLRLGTPMESRAVISQFQNIARSGRADVQKRTDNLRRQLQVYQETAHTFIRSLITAGPATRNKVNLLSMWYFIYIIIVLYCNVLYCTGHAHRITNQLLLICCHFLGSSLVH